MMNSLLEFREKLKDFYADYDVYIRPILRFTLAVISFIAINNSIGYLNQINNIFVILILSVICAILPLNGIVLVGTILIVAHSFGLSMEVGLFALILYLLMVLLYFRFVPKDSLALILTPVAFYFHVPVLVPLSLGLIRGPLSCITVIFGVVSWKYVESLPTVIAPMLNSSDSSVLEILQALPRALVSVQSILTMITFVVVLLVVATIRKLVSGHSWEIGIVSGAVVYYGLTIAGDFILHLNINILEETVGTLLSVAVCFFLEFFYYSADYSRTEYLQFEDDRNYYYVRITPKRMPAYRGETNEADQETESIPEDDSRFTEAEELSDVEKKFEGVNLQSMLEKSLKNLNTNQSGRENAPEDASGISGSRTAGGNAESRETQGDTSGDTKMIGDIHLSHRAQKTGGQYHDLDSTRPL